ncbi:SDR family oxidoreductase [Clostridium sp. 19966]|uniref:SDR family NAD(P)-dependent oxidoreductase n=1 Tax=Clostridium sp. 19966 TaxID=2768166 RepID=UPI0028E080BD|nr:SDR family oxidoreductase [Clostridium sp. 19966]MDT8717942.1 SDR family oxidoreductase [Clostridium sp. 19966]
MSKTVLITGASSGFGYEFVKLFTKDGFDLILVARNKGRLEEIKKEFSNSKITVIEKDLTKPNSVKELYNEIKEKSLKVDVLVNNAGYGLFGEFDKIDIEKQINMINLNIAALTELTYYVVKDMKANKSGKILNVASLAAFFPGPLMAAYYATKAYVLSISQALAEELKGTGVTVTALCPGPSATNFAKAASADKTKLFANGMSAEVVSKIGYDALMQNKRVVVSGKMNKLGAFFGKRLPQKLVTSLVKKVSLR